MRVVIDTNILVSALLSPHSAPADLISHWRRGGLTLVTSRTQLEEVRRVLAYPKIRGRLQPHRAGRLINDLRQLAVIIEDLPDIAVSPDPHDDHLLAAADVGRAHLIVTGDRRDLLSLGRYKGIRIVTVRAFLDEL